MDRLANSNQEDIDIDKCLSLFGTIIDSPITKKAKPVTHTNLGESKVTNGVNKNIFIVHGHDDGLKNEVARFVQSIDLEPIILHEKPSQSRTIIEKIESYSDVGFAFILYTACDTGGKKEEDAILKNRARQNVVFEHGYFIGLLGRKKVVALVKGDIELPNDTSGIVYIQIDERGAWKQDVIGELRSTGYDVSM